jgi:hypothetical protein
VQAATAQTLSDDEVRASERETEKLLASLAAKQAAIDRLEATNAIQLREKEARIAVLEQANSRM